MGGHGRVTQAGVYLEEGVGEGEDGCGQVAGLELAVPGGQQGQVQDRPAGGAEEWRKCL